VVERRVSVLGCLGYRCARARRIRSTTRKLQLLGFEVKNELSLQKLRLN
jgi:hypothetical protein